MVGSPVPAPGLRLHRRHPADRVSAARPGAGPGAGDPPGGRRSGARGDGRLRRLGERPGGSAPAGRQRLGAPLHLADRAGVVHRPAVPAGGAPARPDDGRLCGALRRGVAARHHAGVRRGVRRAVLGPAEPVRHPVQEHRHRLDRGHRLRALRLLPGHVRRGELRHRVHGGQARDVSRAAPSLARSPALADGAGCGDRGALSRRARAWKGSKCCGRPATRRPR